MTKRHIVKDASRTRLRRAVNWATVEELRFGFLWSGDSEYVLSLGCGTYDGHHVPGVEATGPLVEAQRRASFKVARFVLDSGGVVYESECAWWAHADEIDSLLAKWRQAGAVVRSVGIAEARATGRSTE